MGLHEMYRVTNLRSKSDTYRVLMAMPPAGALAAVPVAFGEPV